MWSNILKVSQTAPQELAHGLSISCVPAIPSFACKAAHSRTQQEPEWLGWGTMLLKWQNFAFQSALTMAQNANGYQKQHADLSLLLPSDLPSWAISSSYIAHFRISASDEGQDPVTSWPHKNREKLLNTTVNVRISCDSKVPGEKVVGILLPSLSLEPAFSLGVQIRALSCSVMFPTSLFCFQI